jgi:hypothetical protein
MSQVPSSSSEHHSWLDQLNKLFPSLRSIGSELGYNIPPDLGKIYNLAAHYNHRDRCPVVVVPGFLGSVLVDQETGIKVWGEFSRKALNPATPEGTRLFGMAMQKGVPLHNLSDGVVATNPCCRARGRNRSMSWIKMVRATRGKKCSSAAAAATPPVWNCRHLQ